MENTRHSAGGCCRLAAWGLCILASGMGWVSEVLGADGREKVTPVGVIRSIPRSTIPQEGIPATVEVTATYVDEAWGMLFVHDGETGVFVREAPELTTIQPGDQLRLRGRIVRAEFSPALRVELPNGLVRLGRGAVPEAKWPDHRRLLRGALDSQRIRLEATLGGVRRDADRRVTAQMVSEFGQFTAHFPPRIGMELTTNLLGARLELVGVCGSEFNAAGQFANFNLFVAATNDVRLVGAPASDLFALPVQAIGEVLSFRADEDVLSFVRVQGVVTHSSPAECVIQSGRHSLRMQVPSSGVRPVPGQRLDVVGIPRPHRFGPKLTACQFRVMSTEALPEPERLTDRGPLQSNTQNGLRVWVEGRVESAAAEAGAHVLVLRADDGLPLEVVVYSEPGEEPVPHATQPGARIRVSGVFEPETELPRKGVHSTVIVPSWRDTVLVEAPVSGRVTRWLVAGGGVLLLGVGGGGVLLLARLRRQARVLRETEERRTELQRRYDQLAERAVDLIYTLDAEGRLIDANRAARELFGLDGESVTGRSVLDVIVPEHRELVRARIGERLHLGDTAAPFVVDVRDRSGERRTLEVTSRVVRVEGESPRIEGVARDITARRRVEDALRALVSTTASGSGIEFFQSVARTLCETLGVDYAFVARGCDPEWSEMEMVAIWGEGRALEPVRYATAGTPCEPMRAGRTIVVEDRLGERYRIGPAFAALGAVAYAGFQLRGVSGEPAGVLAVVCRRPFRPTRYELQLLEILAARVGAELERLRAESDLRAMVQSLQRSNELLLDLNRHQLQAGVGLDRMLQAVAERTREGLEVARVTVWLLSEKRDELNAVAMSVAAGTPAELPGPLRVDDHRAYFVAIEAGRFLAVVDAMTDPRTESFAEPYLRSQGISSMLDAPIRLNGRVCGVLCAEHVGASRAWTAGETLLAGSMADMAAIALQIDRSLGTERALREKEIHYENVVEVLGEGVIVADGRGRFTQANATASRILGVSGELLRSAGLSDEDWDVIRDDGSRMARSDYPAMETLRTGESRSNVVMGVLRPDGERRWLSVNTRPLRDATTGQVSAVVISFIDMTEVRRNRLELERARDAAEASNRAKADFLTVISHEVRTPLNAVLGYADLLEQEVADADLRRYVRTIRQSGENLLEIINGILDFSKLEAGRLKLDHEPFDLLDTAYSVVEMLSVRAVSKGLELGFDWDPEVPRNLSGDAVRVRQVLTNLVGNAVKFTPAGHVLVVARYLPGTPHVGPKVRIRVEDTGPGIPEEKHSLLFQRFSMVDASLTRRHGGTGLGLAIARQLAEAMGGAVGFSSSAGTGAVFWFDLPVPARAGAHPVRPSMPPGSRVILATRQPLAERLLGRHCRHWGIELQLAESAAAARVLVESAADTRPVGVVIADAGIARELGGVGQTAGGMPMVIIPAAMGGAGERGEAETGVAPVLVPPLVHPDRLAGALNEALGIRNPGSRLAP